VPWPYALGDAEAFLAMPREATDLFLLICSREDDTRPLIGGIGLRPDGDAHVLGYWLTPEAWGRGYMTEAARALLAAAHGSLRLTRFRAGHFVDNPASGRVLAKLGFRPTGRTERQPCPTRGGEVETALLELDLDPEQAMPLAA
jgi:RimJ/RimL family protein N-acetyltransferase